MKRVFSKRSLAILLMLTLILQMGLNLTVFAADGEGLTPATQYDLAPFLTSVRVVAQVGDNWVDVTTLPEGEGIPRNSKVEVALEYSPRAQNEGEEDPVFAVGDQLVYQLPQQIVADENQSGRVVDGPTTVGDYVITTDGKIVITLTNEQYLKDTSGLLKSGKISFSGVLDASSWSEEDSGEIKFGELTVEVPLEKIEVVEKGVVNIKKTQTSGGIKRDTANGYYYVDYKIVVSTPADNTKVMTNINVDDYFSTGSGYVDSIVSFNAPAGTTFDSKDLTWDIGDMEPGQTKTLTFRVRLKDSIAAAGTDTERKITNNATVYSNTTKLNSSSVSVSAKASLSIKKSNAGYNKEDGTVTYTVVVTAPSSNAWTMNNVRVVDAFGTGKSFVISYDEFSSNQGTITTSDANKNLTWAIGSLAPGQSATLTYTVDVDPDVFYTGTGTTTNNSIENTATVYTNTTKRGSSNSTVNFKKNWVSKNGTLQADGRVRFVIQANETTNHAPIINGAISFRDTLQNSDWVYDGDVVINWYAQGPANKGEAIGSATVDADGLTSWQWNHSGGYYYEIVYYARLKQDVIGKPSISNKVEVGIVGPDGTVYNHESEWRGTGKEYDAIEKECLSVEGDIATWQTRLISNVPTGSVYTDWRGDAHAWTMTDAQIQAIAVGGAGQGKNYTVTRDGTGFKIVFNEAIEASSANPVTITYQTTLTTSDLAEAESARYINCGKLTVNGHEDSAQAECFYTKEQRIVKTAGTYDPATGLMTWNITVNVTGSLNGDANVVDSLSEGLEFVEAQITSCGGKAGGTTMTVQNNGNVVNMQLHGLVESHDRDAYVTITLVSRVVDTKFLVSNGEKTFTNTALLHYRGQEKESAAQQTITNNILGKRGVYDKNTAPDIVYTITINPNGIDLLRNAETINITDTMGDGLMLKRDTLKIVNTKTGDVIAAENLMVNGSTFSFDVPDNQPLTITYNAYVIGEPGTQVSVTNTVAFTGYEDVSMIDAQNAVYIMESNASVEGVTAFYISKLDDAFGTALAGAEYTLRYVNEDGSIGDVVMTSLSDHRGIVSFIDINEHRVYAFNETKTVDGYYIDEVNINYTYIAFNSDAITEGMNDLNVLVVQRGTVFERTNKRGEIFIEKQFEGPAADGVYYFGLFDENDELLILGDKPAVAGSVVTDGVVMSQARFRGVPFGTYKVFETDAEGNKLDADGDGVVVVYETRYEVTGDGTRVTVTEADATENVPITNTYVKPYVAIGATKAFAGQRYAGDVDFTFQLLEGDTVVDEVTVTGSGAILFDDIYYEADDAGAHTYTVCEVLPEKEDSRITYDETVYTVEVFIEKTAEEGQIARVLIDGEEAEGIDGVYMLPEKTVEGETGSFVNIYERVPGTGDTLRYAHYVLTLLTFLALVFVKAKGAVNN